MTEETTENKHDAGEKSVPYFEKVMACPMCGEKSTHWQLKENTYVVEECQEDQFVSKFHWVKPEYNKFHFYFFRFWYCPSCGFTDGFVVFYNPDARRRGHDIGAIKKIFQKQAESDPFIQYIKSFVNYPAETILDAVLLHFLALYIQFMVDSFHQNHEKIARICLRTAWIFRLTIPEMNREQTEKKVEAELQELQAHLEQLRLSVLNTARQAEKLNEWCLERVRKQKNISGFPLWSDYRQQFEKLQESMGAATDSIGKDLAEYREISSDYKERFLSGESGPFQMNLTDYQNFYNFVESLKEYWPGLPAGEEEALEKAAEALIAVIDSGQYSRKRIKLYRYYELLVIVLQNAGNLSEALRFSMALHERLIAQKQYSEETLKQLEAENADEDKLKTLRLYLNKITNLIEQNTEKREILREQIFEARRKKAREIFEQNQNSSPAELRQLMEKEKIPEVLIQKFTQALAHDKKKGIFQIFKL